MRPFTGLSDLVAAQKERPRRADRTRNPLTPQVARKAPKSVEKR
jgi:hypothetical protein